MKFSKLALSVLTHHLLPNGVVEQNNKTLEDALYSMLLNFYDGKTEMNCYLNILHTFSNTSSKNFLILGSDYRLPDQLVHGTHSTQLVMRSRYVGEMKEPPNLAKFLRY